MSTFQRQPLTQLSTNRLNRSQTDLGKTKLPNIAAMFSPKGPMFHINKDSTHKTPSSLSFSESPSYSSKSSKSAINKKNAEKLKTRLQVALYKIRTKQTTTPISEIMRNHPCAFELYFSEKKQNAAVTTPLINRHVSLLAASTPLNSKNLDRSKANNNQKKVSFIKSRSFAGPISDRTLLPQIPESTVTTSPQRPSPNKRGLDNENKITSLNITPIKGNVDANGELLMSSPTKKAVNSTPSSYAAAKSLLEFSSFS